MKIKFNELGAVIETITNDEPLRQGNIGANTLAAIFEGKINARYSATFNFTRSDGSKINNVVMSANIENIDEFDFTFKDAFFFALAGETTITVFLRDGAGNVIANGQIKFNIEKTDFDENVPIDFDQYNQLLSEIDGKTNKTDFDNSALEINTLTYSQCKTLSTKVIYKAFDNGVPCLLINRGLTPSGYVLNVMMADATFNLKKITVPESGENIIENYTTYEESKPKIIDLTPYIQLSTSTEGTITQEGYNLIDLTKPNVYKITHPALGDIYAIVNLKANNNQYQLNAIFYDKTNVDTVVILNLAIYSNLSLSLKACIVPLITYVDNKYTKPSTGIPKSDLSSEVQTSLNKADTAIQQSDLTSYSLAVDAAHSLEMTIDSSTYILTTKLKNKAGEVLGTPQTIDLPLEAMVVNGKYDENTKSIILTLNNGQTISFSVADLVSGLQTEITSENKLSADLVKDGSTNKVFTTDDKNSLQRMQTDLEHIGPIIDKVGKVVVLTPYITFTSSSSSISSGNITQEGYNLIDVEKPHVYKLKVEGADVFAIASLSVAGIYYFTAVVSGDPDVDGFVTIITVTITQSLSVTATFNKVALLSFLNTKYTKPADGIPESDLDSSVQSKLNKPVEQIEATSLNDALATITNSIKGNNDYTSNGYRQKIYVFKNNSISVSYYIFPLHYGISISRDFNQHFLVIEGLTTANAEFNYYRCTIPFLSSSATEDNVSKIGTLKDDFTNVVNKTSENTEDLPNRLKITIQIKYRASNLFDFEEDIFHKIYNDCLIIESTPLTLDFYNEIKDNNGTVRIVLNHPVKNKFKNIKIPSQISRKGKLGFYHYNNYGGVVDIENLQSILDNETIIVEPNDLVQKNGKWIIRKIIPLRDILNIVLPDIYKPISYGNTIGTLGMGRTFVGAILSYRQQFDVISKRFVNLPPVSPLRRGWRRGVINRQIFYPINQLNTNEDIIVEGRFLIHKGGCSIRARLTTGGQGGYLFSWNPVAVFEVSLPYSKKKPRWSFNRCAVGFSLCKLNHPTASEYAYEEPIFAKKYPLANKKLVLKSTPYVDPGFNADYQTYCKTEIYLKDNK